MLIEEVFLGRIYESDAKDNELETKNEHESIGEKILIFQYIFSLF